LWSNEVMLFLIFTRLFFNNFKPMLIEWSVVSDLKPKDSELLWRAWALLSIP
jgi:hypothetical protein